MAAVPAAPCPCRQNEAISSLDQPDPLVHPVSDTMVPVPAYPGSGA